jgi:fructose-1,6-bisphosphatase I
MFAGTSLLGAGYCLYSSSTVLVLTLGNGVNGFTYDSNVGEFILSHPNVQIPDKGAIYSFNEGNYEVRLLHQTAAACVAVCMSPTLRR